MHWAGNSRRNNTLYSDICYSKEIKLQAFRCAFRNTTYWSCLIINSMRSSSSVLGHTGTFAELLVQSALITNILWVEGRDGWAGWPGWRLLCRSLGAAPEGMNWGMGRGERAPLPALFAVSHCPLAASAQGQPAVRESQGLRGVIPEKPEECGHSSAIPFC